MTEETRTEERDEEFRKQFLLAQYNFALEERARNANKKWQVLALGNAIVGFVLTAIASPLVAASPPPRADLVSMILSGFAISMCFFIYIAYRKLIYFEDLFSENVEAIESLVGGIKLMQYDTYPQKDPSLYYVVRQPRKASLAHISLHTVMAIILGIYLIAALAMFCIFGWRTLFPKPYAKPLYGYALILLGIAFLPVLYLVALLLNRQGRVGKTMPRPGK